MFQSFAASMNGLIEQMMFDSRCLIARPNPDGTWTTLGEYPCNVQATSLSSSVEDHSVAQSDDIKYIYMFIGPDTPVAPGYRVDWGNRFWNVGAENTERATRGLTRVILTDWQIAVEPENITFTRLRNGVRTTVGTYAVHVVLNDFSTLASAGRDVYSGNTALGEIDTGTMVGDADLANVQVGDWFTRNGLPGRVTTVLHGDSERSRIAFSLDREAR